MNKTPQVGDFIRPVCCYGYCLEAVKLTEYGTGKQITYRRHGMVDGQPFNDGHCHTGHYLNSLVRTSEGCWKEPAFNGYPATYYRKMHIQQPARGQLSLFGGGA